MAVGEARRMPTVRFSDGRKSGGGRRGERRTRRTELRSDWTTCLLEMRPIPGRVRVRFHFIGKEGRRRFCYKCKVESM